jgi:hypothetical protein
MLDNMLITNG